MPKVEASQQTTTQISIIATNTDSEPFEFGAWAQAGFILPAGFEGTSVSFLVSADNETYVPFYDGANLVSVAVDESRAYAFPINLFPFTWIKFKSQATESQDRVIAVVSKY